MKCSFWCSHVSRLESLVSLWPRRVYGGSCKTCLLGVFQTSLWFSCGLAVSMGEAAKHVLLACFQAACHVVLRGRRGTL